MLRLGDLFQWQRFVTPSIIKLFFWLMIAILVLFGLSGIVSALGRMAVSPILGAALIALSVLGVMAGVVFARMVTEFILIVFRINEHLAAIRNQGEMYESSDEDTRMPTWRSGSA